VEVQIVRRMTRRSDWKLKIAVCGCGLAGWLLDRRVGGEGGAVEDEGYGEEGGDGTIVAVAFCVVMRLLLHTFLWCAFAI
jgi:hypothetical protein